MKTTIQARLDDETSAALESLQRRLGLSQSEIVRESLRLMLQQQSVPKQKKILGLGEFDSGIPDLASNKKYLETLGQHSGLDGESKRKRKVRREESVA